MAIPTADPTRVNADVRPLGADRSLLITPSGRLFEVDAPAIELAEAVRGLATAPVLAEAGRVWQADLPAVLHDTGALTADHEATGHKPADMPPLSVVADGPLLELITRLGLLSPTDQARPVDALRSTPGAVLLVIRDHLDSRLLLAVDDQRAAIDAPWVQFHLDQGRAWMGPAIAPGHTVTYREVLARRRCAAERLDLAEALLAPTLTAPLRPPPAPQLLWMLTMFFAEVRRWLAGDRTALLGNEIEADPRQTAVTLHPVLPLPDRELPSGNPVNHHARGIDLLRDDRLGIVTAVHHVEHDACIPRQLATVQVDVADMARLYPWATNTLCGGSVFHDVHAAEAAAIGEGVERYCGNWVRPDLLREASFAQLTAAGEHAVDPHSLALYSAAQHREPGFPFVPFTHDLPVHWVQGRSVATDRPVWVPASLVYVNWYVGPFAGAPKTNFPLYAGLAGGDSFDTAVRSGLEEVIERDATMIWWANRPRLPVIDLPPRLAALFDGAPSEHGQRAWLLSLDNTFGVPVLAGVVENTRDRLLTIGFAARSDPEQAALKAWAEALTLQEITRDLQDPNGLFWQAVHAGDKRQGFTKPWRADRGYLDDFRGDFRDVGDLECQLQVNLDPRAVKTVHGWVTSNEHRPFDTLPRLPDRSMDVYLQRLDVHGYDAIAVDITTPDVAASGLRVVRTIVPGLVSNFPAAFPFLGRRRLAATAAELGWCDAPPDDTALNFFPLPHA